ncbi:MAG: MotA/TolQ/ExbB proton channel family protein [Planctomycetota bacterium]|nr:MAG: MotA/TolQ/ExbB proton channel family protein [Planctomycetota bacterium]
MTPSFASRSRSLGTPARIPPLSRLNHARPENDRLSAQQVKQPYQKMLRLRSLGLFLLCFLMTQGALFAQEGAPTETESTGFFGAISKGGAIGYVIIGLSVVAMTLVIEHFVNIKRDKLAPPEAIDEIEELFNEGQYQEALEYCEAEGSFFTHVVAAGIRKLGHPFETIEKALEEMEDEENIKLQQKIGWLSLIAGISPMMGLFGTVFGMVGAFSTIATAASVEPRDFAGDISLALITTVLGLTVAIPTTAFFVFFRNRVTMMTLEISAIVEEMFERFRHQGD